MPNKDATTAVRRFGLGAHQGELKLAGGDPRGYVLAQLSKPEAAVISAPDLPPSHILLADQRRARRERRRARQAAGAAGERPAMMDGGAAGGPMRSGAMQERSMRRAGKLGRFRRQAYRKDAMARVAHGAKTDAPFVERLVLFWSNHFCVSAAKANLRAIAGAYEREVIRPNVLGRFGDMLLAAEQHPAMLIYLDNAGSVGPNSRAGRRRGKGLNENLAREILELHTLGVNGGYTQTDVTNFARIITGWSISKGRRKGREAGKFFFARNRHEPGAWSVAGKRYRDLGRQSGEMVLADLARHRATARHIAQKLAVHFVSDNPPPGLVRKLERVFLDTGGDLRELAKALVMAPEVWAAPASKMLPPYDFIVSIMRGFDVEPPARELNRLMKILGQPLWRVPSPKGWPDGNSVWAAPAALRERLRIAGRAARHIGKRGSDPRTVADDLIGPGLSEETRLAIARADTRQQGFELLIMSPEFQRR